jgi:hypothetical protein
MTNKWTDVANKANMVLRDIVDARQNTSFNDLLFAVDKLAHVVVELVDVIQEQDDQN